MMYTLGKRQFTQGEVLSGLNQGEYVRALIERGHVYDAQRTMSAQYAEGVRAFQDGMDVHGFEPWARRLGWDDAKSGFIAEVGA